MKLTDLSLLELGRRLAAGEASSVEAVQACLERIRRLDGRVKAFLLVDEKGALVQAEAADARRRSGTPKGPLDGVPVALKDLFCTEGLATTAGSRILEGFLPPFDATVVQLLKAAGLPILGKLNMDEFAMGSSTENSAYFPSANPWDLTRSPGGSSGGSAAAVAARFAFGALGTDTGGSIRQPAALTGMVGLKPTYGRVSRYGVVAFARRLDQVGPLARTVGDAAALLQVLAGHDARRFHVLPRGGRRTTCAHLDAGVNGLRLGVPREYFSRGHGPGGALGRGSGGGCLPEAGGALVRQSRCPTPSTRSPPTTWWPPPRPPRNLARYDGVRYGLRVARARPPGDVCPDARAEGFGPRSSGASCSAPTRSRPATTTPTT